MEKGEYSRAYLMTNADVALVAMALTKMFLQAMDGPTSAANDTIAAGIKDLMERLNTQYKAERS